MSPRGDVCSSASHGGHDGMLYQPAAGRLARPSNSSLSCDPPDCGNRESEDSPAALLGGGGSSGENAERDEKLAPNVSSLFPADSATGDDACRCGLSDAVAVATVGTDSPGSDTASDVVSVPLHELESLIARLKAAKTQMGNLKKIVDMQTSIIFGLKATIRARYERPDGMDEAGGLTTTCGGIESRSPRPKPAYSAAADSLSMIPLPTSPLPVAGAASSAASFADRMRLPHTDGLRRAFACTAKAEVYVDRGPRAIDRASTPLRVGSPSAASGGGVDRTVFVPHDRLRNDGDSSFTPASPSRTVPAAQERKPFSCTAWEAAASTAQTTTGPTREDFGLRVSPPGGTSISPFLFAARLPAAGVVGPPPAAHREKPAHCNRTAAPPKEWLEAAAGTAAESSCFGSEARNNASSQPAAGLGLNCQLRRGERLAAGGFGVTLPTSDSIAGGRRCPICQRTFAADVSVSDFQCHVLECNIGAELIDTAVGTASVWTGGATSPKPVNPGVGDDDRTCPLCEAHYPAAIPLGEFEQHVLSHFQDE